jgi:hypothetical protein
MIIKSVRVINFRSIADETLYCERLTAIVGRNGAGKSSFLRAVDLFYSTSPKVDADDFYDGETDNEIVISITFGDLSERASEAFSPYIQNGQLTVERVFRWDGTKAVPKYHGSKLQHQLFDSIRKASSAAEKKTLYEGLRQEQHYISLPKWRTVVDGMQSLLNWESEHPEDCVRQRDDGQFFGFTEVAQGCLKKFTTFLFIPAIRDASDSADGPKSSLKMLMDLVVRNIIASKSAVKELRDETQKRYEELIAPARSTELPFLSNKLSETLKTFAPEASVDLRWLPLEDVSIPMPRADTRLVEDGYSAPVDRTGHGLQRAFVLTMLQHLALARTDAEKDVPSSGLEPSLSVLPDLVLAIEEPELYQHPNRQRHTARILAQLADGSTPGVAEKTQVLFATHSPHFVSMERINGVRLLRKVELELGKPKVTKVFSTSLDEVAEAVWRCDGATGEKYSGGTLLPRLKSLMTTFMSEGFFADAVVLVEGDDDRAAILGMSEVMNVNLESDGISVLPCGGKGSLDRPAVIFSQLGIPIYIVWDSDKGDKEGNPADNHRLLRLVGQEIIDYPVQVEDNFACFEKNLETTLRNEIGAEEFDRHLKKCQVEMGIKKRKHAMKNPAVIASIIRAAQSEGIASGTLMDIIVRIQMLKIEDR